MPEVETRDFKDSDEGVNPPMGRNIQHTRGWRWICNNSIGAVLLNTVWRVQESAVEVLPFCRVISHTRLNLILLPLEWSSRGVSCV